MPDGSGPLGGDRWTVRTLAQRPGESLQTIEIQADYLTREEWSARFWNAFPSAEIDFRERVRDPGIFVIADFSFRPTVRLRERYGPHPAGKMRRVARYWSGHRQPPPELIAPIGEFERDQAALDAQRDTAWRHFVRFRLPEPPFPYFWQPQSVCIVMGDERWFRLWHPDFQGSSPWFFQFRNRA